MNITDLNLRQEALDLAKSFIVQAPAGSGKTTLLTERIKSIALAKHSAIAITFTKKAANEMQERIVKAVGADKLDKIQIITFDALCQKLIKEISTDANIHPYPSELYQRAVGAMLADENINLQKNLDVIRSYLENRQDYMLSFFKELLAKRDQWLLWIMVADQKSNYLGCWVIARKYYTQYLKIVSTDIKSRIDDALRHSCSTLGVEFNDGENYDIAIKNLQLFTSIILKKDGSLRSRVDSRQGFLPAAKIANLEKKKQATIAKENIMYIINFIKQHPDIHNLMADISCVPLDHIDNAVLSAIKYCLPRLTAHLNVILDEQNQYDFLENSIRAIDTLNNPEFADKGVIKNIFNTNHILVDEAQDTSWMQYQLLKSLTQHWQDAPNNSIFIVGDPSQSIYKFRQAQVSLFAHLAECGINNIKLKPIVLSSNFRSQANLVNWSNSICKNIFPKTINFDLGAVPFAPSTPILQKKDPVNYIWLKEASALDQIEIMCQEIKKNSSQSTILLRSRTQAKNIISRLKRHSITYYAHELIPLTENQAIRDLIALTRALIEPFNTAIWCACLRSPMFGFTLQNIHEVTQFNSDILQALKTLSTQNPKYENTFNIFNHAREKLTTNNLDIVVRDLWYSINSPYALSSAMEHEAAESFFKTLKTLCNIESEPIYLLEEYLSKLYIDQTSAENVESAHCQIMTIHKAKGLEFDNVYLPFLDQSMPPTAEQLLWWHNIIDDSQNHLCLLAPANSSKYNSKLTELLKNAEKQKNLFEIIRLFYVAITRAKHTLTLIASLDSNNTPGNKSSLLAHIWPYIEDKKTTAYSKIDIHKEINMAPVTHVIKNLKQQSNNPRALNIYSFKTSDYSPQLFGDLAHKLIEIKTTSGRLLSIKQMCDQALIYLAMNHVPKSSYDLYIKKTRDLLTNLENCEKFQWIIRPHYDEKSEYEILYKNNFYRIDRTFVENNTRWIIDYKTGLQQNLTPSSMIGKHKEQLLLYAQYFKLHENLKISLGIYHLDTGIWASLDA